MASDALHDLFVSRGEVRSLPGGETLLKAGEASGALYLLTAGRLASVDPRRDGGARVLSVHRPGAILGGIGLLSGAAHPADLTALRDSEVRVLPRATIEPELHENSALLAELARKSLMRVAQPEAKGARKASILGFVAVCDSVAMRALVEALAACMRALGVTAVVVGAEASQPSSAQLSELETRHDYVLMAAERQDFDFTDYCGRQIDRLVLVGSAHSPLPEAPVPFAAVAIQRNRLLDFILIQPADIARPVDSTRWLSAAPAARLFHIRKDDARDLARLARVFTGRSTGVVLSGGGARAYAHIGVLRALDELGVEIDFVSGTSMGAVIAAGVAMGWSQAELDMRIRDAFVSSSPLSDIAFPLLAMTHGREVDRRLKTHFGETLISDMWRPFTCVSTNLTTGELFSHRLGLLRTALRASISLPGVLPPVVSDGQVLVDGALARNLPADLMRDQHDGTTIGVDAAHASGLYPEELMLRPSGLRWLTSGAWLKGPPIVSVLIRAATLPNARAADAAVREALDITINPKLDGVQLRDWKAYDPAVEAGYRAAMEQADALLAAGR